MPAPPPPASASFTRPARGGALSRRPRALAETVGLLIVFLLLATGPALWLAWRGGQGRIVGDDRFLAPDQAHVARVVTTVHFDRITAEVTVSRPASPTSPLTGRDAPPPLAAAMLHLEPPLPSVWMVTWSLDPAGRAHTLDLLARDADGLIRPVASLPFGPDADAAPPRSRSPHPDRHPEATP